MNFATLKGLTIPVPQTVIPETTETSTILLGDDTGFIGSYVVTVDGAEYHCDTFFNEMMEPSLGDSRLYGGDTSNPVDVPFYIVSGLTSDWTTGEEYWACDVFYPDSNAHTIEIKKMVDASVTQITDASGQVLWKQAPSAVTVNLICPSQKGIVTIDGTKYINAGTYEALESVVVGIQGYYGMVNGSMKTAVAYLYLNGVKVAQTPTSPPPQAQYTLSLEGCTEVTIEYINENSTYSSVYNCYITTK